MQELSMEKKNRLLRLKPTEIGVSDINKLFGYRHDEKFNVLDPEYSISDVIRLKAGEYTNKKDVVTTAGKLLFNKLCIEGKIDDLIPDGYFNKTFTAKVFNELTSYCSAAIMKSKIDPKTGRNETVERVVSFMQAFEFYGLKCCAIFSPSFTEGILKPNTLVNQKKEELMAGFDPNNTPLSAMVDLEDELVRIAKGAAADDPGMTLYDSGSRGSFDNDYKNISVIIGPMMNTNTGEFDFMTSNYMDGIKKEDIYKAGNGVVAASYPKAVGTAVGGYLTKQFYSVYQAIVLDEPGTDCGSKFTLDVELDKGNVSEFMYQYMVEGRNSETKYICLLPENADSYIGKTVHFRSPMGCLNPKICHVCAGDRFRRLDIKNIGLTTGKVSNNLMNKQMKKFHNAKVKMDYIKDPDQLLI